MVTPSGSATYTIHLECSADAACFYDASVNVTVETPPVLGEVFARDLFPCNLGLEVTWAPATFNDVSGSGAYNVYRSETSCADALAQPPVATALETPRWVATDTLDGHSYFFVVEAEDASARGPCMPRGPNNGGAVARSCAAPVTETADGSFPTGVYAVLRARHSGNDVTLLWPTARALLPGEHFHLLEARDTPQRPFELVNGEGFPGTSWTENDITSRLMFFDLRVANACEQLSLDEYPPG
jgi:hypothetical protein